MVRSCALPMNETLLGGMFCAILFYKGFYCPDLQAKCTSDVLNDICNLVVAAGKD